MYSTVSGEVYLWLNVTAIETFQNDAVYFVGLHTLPVRSNFF